MSAIKAHLHTLADEAGISVGQYLYELDQERRLRESWEEYEFHKSVHDGSYFKTGYEKEEE